VNDFKVKEKDRIQLSKGSHYTFTTTLAGTEIYLGSDLVAQLAGVFLGAGVITNQSWVLLR
jgi:hypothetical protein